MFLNLSSLSDEIQNCVLYADLIVFNYIVNKMRDSAVGKVLGLCSQIRGIPP